jgi:small subunit ribosomal protein S17
MAHILTGVVTSDKPDKTVVISVTTRKTHPLYKKQYNTHSKFMVHDEKNEAKVGDLISAAETRPLSARKRYILTKILNKAGAHFEEADATADVPVEEPKAKSQKPKATAAELSALDSGLPAETTERDAK